MRDWLRRQPFELLLSCTYRRAPFARCCHGVLAFLTRRSITLGVLVNPEDDVPDRSTTVSLLHVVRVEPLSGGATPRGNGHKGEA